MPVKVYDQTIIAQATLSANLAANSLTPMNLTLDPTVGSQNSLQVPQTESWVIDDIYVTASQDVDGILTVRKNVRADVIKTDPVNSLLVSNPSRPKISKKVFAPGDIITAIFQNLAAVGTSAVTITVYIKIKRFVEE